MKLRPDIKGCQWLLQKTEGAVAVDWNVKNHHKVIDFYKELIQDNPKVSRNYLELMDNLLADNRTKEAREYLDMYKTLEGHLEFQVPIYEGRIALAEHDVNLGEAKFRELEERFPENSGAIFELANHYAEQCDYEKAIEYYEKSFALDMKNGNHPVFTDALEAMAIIRKIQGQYEESVKCYDRMLKQLEDEFGFTEGEPVREVLEEKQRLIDFVLK